ncbi:MAG TPA: DUF4386 domain-containing protein [Methanomassiliicoccales archaeon]|nr:DUF4386 domain-containing protein [Methanomassiliicoccales archaeon]
MNALHVFGEGHGPAKRNGQSNSMNKTAKIAGSFYLAFILTFVLASYLRSQFIVSGDAAATAHNIAANELMPRIAFIAELVSALFFLLAAWALYVLLRPVDKNLALLFLLLNLGGVAVECSSMLNLFAALPLLSGADYLAAFSAGQLEALALASLNLYKDGVMVAQLFYGTWLLPLGYLVNRSGYLPRWLGVLLILDFLGVMIWFLQFFLLPGSDVLSYPGLAVSFIAEVSLTLWLLIKGVKDNGPASTEGG